MVFDNNNFFADFLDDYFAECDEHLTALRHNLLTLESFLNQPQIPRALLNDLFRSFHSLKGLSGMVGAKESEQLAHEMEGYLKALRESELVLTPAGFDALFAGTKQLEQAIAAHRNQQPIPDISEVVGRLRGVMPQETPPAPRPLVPEPLKLKEAESADLAAALAQGATAWHFTFSPSTELAARNINVNTIRDRLQTIGTLIHASPRMTPQGGIAFDFIVTRSDPHTLEFAGWQEEGLTWTRYGNEAEAQPAEDGDSPIAETQQTVVNPNPSAPSVALLGEVLPPSGLPATTATPLIAQASNVVRVDLPKLDELMQMVANLAISRARLEEQLGRLQGVLAAPQLRSLQEINLSLNRQLRDLREGVMRVRLVSVGEIFARMQFVVRDLMRESQKQVVLELSGQETEIDKFVVERMMDPLLHLVRNAVSHGIEAETERVQKGKPPEGKLTLRAFAAGEMVVLEIEDDGQGIDVKKVLARARNLGLLDDPTGLSSETCDSETLLDILCSPGFSTREEADLTSGRGVGMAIVKNTVQELGGCLSVQTQLGQSTRFTIQLPLTLAIADALIAIVSGQTFAIPLSAVREILELAPNNIIHLENNQLLRYRGMVLPLLHLTHLFRWSGREAGETKETETPDSFVSGSKRAIILSSGFTMCSLFVDRIIGQREIVVRALTDPLVQVFGIAGATELGDGRAVLILDIAALVRSSSKAKIKHA